MKKRDLAGLIIVSLILGLVTGVNYAQSSTGNWNSFSLGWVETQNINATNYYLGGVNITDELGGTWGALTATTLDTGQGAYELYNMDQNLQTTDDVTFGTVDTGQGANDLYDMDQNVQTTDDVVFDSVNATDFNFTSEFYYNDENITDVLANPELAYSYKIFKVDSSYYCKNGSSGQIDQTDTDFEDIIEWAWADLSDGGIIQLYGPGQAWEVTAAIDSQSENITIRSDWSLELKAMDALDDNVIDIRHDWVTLDSVKVHGNKDGGTWAAANNPTVIIAGCSHIKLLNMHLSYAHRFGLWIQGCYDVEFTGYYGYANWNPITIVGSMAGVPTDDVGIWGHDLFVEEFSDVGITICTGASTPQQSVLIETFIIRNSDSDWTTGASNSRWGFAVEGYGNYFHFRSGIVENCIGRGATIANSQGGSVDDVTFIKCDTQAGGGGLLYDASASGWSFTNLKFYDCAYNASSAFVFKGDFGTADGIYVNHTTESVGTINCIYIDDNGDYNMLSNIYMRADVDNVRGAYISLQ